jgi:hypothetical protein
MPAVDKSEDAKSSKPCENKKAKMEKWKKFGEKLADIRKIHSVRCVTAPLSRKNASL